MMKALRRVTDQLEGQMIEGLLKSHGLDVHLIGAKDYMAHTMGGRTGHYDLMVPEAQFLAAEQILAGQEVPMINLAASPASHFRRAIFQATLGVIILPILFNCLSVLTTLRFWRSSQHELTDLLKVILLVLLQIPGLLMAFFLIQAFLGS